MSRQIGMPPAEPLYLHGQLPKINLLLTDVFGSLFQNQWMRIDLGEYYNVGYIGLQGHPGTVAYVKQFYLKYSPDGLRWSVYGYNPPSQSYKVNGKSYVIMGSQ